MLAKRAERFAAYTAHATKGVVRFAAFAAAHFSAACASVLVAGCGPGGVQQAPFKAPPSTVRTWEHLDEARRWPLAGDAIASGHGIGDYLVSVRVSPPYRAAYLGLVAGQQWPTGLAVAAFHEHCATHEPASIYAMTKVDVGRWEYVVTRPDGVIEARGSIPLCIDCHAEARADSLFGLSPPATAAESASAPLRSHDDPVAR